MIDVKSKEDIEAMREGGSILGRVMEALKIEVKPGVSTGELDNLAKNLILKNNAQSSFLGYNGYPKSICTSINEEVVHGIPSSRKLKEGDILSLDAGIFYKGFHTDVALTLPVGEISPEDKKLVDSAKKGLFAGLKKVKEGIRIGDISSAIQKSIENDGFSVIRDCTGHGIGKELHEEPSVPNYGEPGTGEILKEGNTIAIEPMACFGNFPVKTQEDGWTIVTSDGKKSAHFEFTILVRNNDYENLTPVEI